MKRSNCSVPSQLRKENYMIDTEFLCRSRLFRGFTKEEITSLLEAEPLQPVMTPESINAAHRVAIIFFFTLESTSV